MREYIICQEELPGPVRSLIGCTRRIAAYPVHDREKLAALVLPYALQYAYVMARSKPEALRMARERWG